MLPAEVGLDKTNAGQTDSQTGKARSRQADRQAENEEMILMLQTT